MALKARPITTSAATPKSSASEMRRRPQRCIVQVYGKEFTLSRLCYISCMAHIHEKLDFTVEVFIVHGNKLLLRWHDKVHIWLSIGGHVELHEDFEEAALREVKEEVGLDVKLIGSGHTLDVQDTQKQFRPVLAPRYMGRHPISHTHEHVVGVYFATTTSNELVLEKPTDKVIWVTKADILEDKIPLVKNVRAYALAALDELASQ